MKKLKLDLDNLKVDSFITTPESTKAPGTVFGQTGQAYSCDLGTCNGATCDAGPGCIEETNGCDSGDTLCWRCSAACTAGEQTCECGPSTVACTSIDTMDCGDCNGGTNYNNSCTDAQCTYCANAC